METSFAKVSLLNSVNDADGSSPHELQFLNYWVSCLPMFAIKSPSNKKRWLGFNIFCIGIVLVIAVAGCSYWTIVTYEKYQINFYSVTHTVAVVTLSLSRIVSLYYFATQFNYPWKSLSIDDVAHAKSLNTRFKTEICVGITLSAILFGLDYELGLSSLISDVLYTYFVHLPILFTQFVMSVIFFQAQRKLEHLTHIIRNDESADFDRMLSEYAENRRRYEMQYKTLGLFVMLKFISSIAFKISEVGVDVLSQFGHFSPTTTEILSIIRYGMYAARDIVPMVEFFIAASKVTSAFKTLHTQLWNMGHEMQRRLLPPTNPVFCKYVHLVNYVSWHPMNVMLLGCEVSKTNATRILLIYAAKVLYNTVRF